MRRQNYYFLSLRKVYVLHLNQLVIYKRSVFEINSADFLIVVTLEYLTIQFSHDLRHRFFYISSDTSIVEDPFHIVFIEIDNII